MEKHSSNQSWYNWCQQVSMRFWHRLSIYCHLITVKSSLHHPHCHKSNLSDTYSYACQAIVITTTSRLVIQWHKKEYALLELEWVVLVVLSSYRRFSVVIIAYTYMQTNLCMKRPPIWQQAHSGLIHYLPYLVTVENLLLPPPLCKYSC